MRVAALVAFVLVACSDFSARPLYQIPKEHYRVVDQAGDEVKEIELTTPTTTVEQTRLSAGDRIGFNHEGCVVQIKNKSPTRWKRLDIPAGSKLTITPNSHDFSALTHELQSIQVGGAVRYGNVDFLAGDDVQINEGNGQPRSAVLKGAHAIGGQQVADGSEVTFNAVGEVTASRTRQERATLARQSERCRLKCAELTGDSNATCYNQCMGF